MKESTELRVRKQSSEVLSGDVLFLDVDGVLSCFAFSPKDLDPSKIGRLKRIVEACDPVIVVSSSWQFDPEQLMGLVGVIEGIGGRFGGTTCGDLGSGASESESLGIKGLQIQGWLDRKGVPNRFVILDDECDMGPLQPHLVRTDSFKGLTDEISSQVITMLCSIDDLHVHRSGRSQGCGHRVSPDATKEKGEAERP